MRHFEPAAPSAAEQVGGLDLEDVRPGGFPWGGVPTTYMPDASRGILATNDSPDIPFKTSLNPYRGCEHGCVYCYARPTHEFLGMSAGLDSAGLDSAGLDFESRILVKYEAPELLRAELARKHWRPQPIAIGVSSRGCVTDPYQPIERKLGITRRCLQVLAEFRNPVSVITRSHLVTRDVDVLRELAEHRAVSVAVSVTTLSAGLARTLEPRASRPAHRLHTIHALAEAGIPVGVMVAPVIPGLTDEEMPAILQAAAKAGASFAGHVVLRLPCAGKTRRWERGFSDWLDVHMPDRKEKVLLRLKSLRSRGGAYAKQIADLFKLGRWRAGIPERGPALATRHFRVPTVLRDGGQLSFF